MQTDKQTNVVIQKKIAVIDVAGHRKQNLAVDSALNMVSGSKIVCVRLNSNTDHLTADAFMEELGKRMDRSEETRNGEFNEIFFFEKDEAPASGIVNTKPQDEFSAVEGGTQPARIHIGQGIVADTPEEAMELYVDRVRGHAPKKAEVLNAITANFLRGNTEGKVNSLFKRLCLVLAQNKNKVPTEFQDTIKLAFPALAKASTIHPFIKGRPCNLHSFKLWALQKAARGQM